MHTLDPRLKILAIFATIVVLFLSGTYAAMALMVAFVVFLMLISRISLKIYLKNLKFVFFIVAFTAILNLFYGTGEPVLQLGFATITQDGIYNSIFVTLRIICLILLSAILTFTTSPTDLTDALERLLKPLALLGVNISDLAVMMTIALRFIPTLIEELQKIIAAQKARGADLESGNILQRARALLPILVPLFISSFRRAYELATAMECRCYRGGEFRSRMKVLRLKKLDYLAITFICIFYAGVLLCSFQKILP